ncbi:MAG TPA: metallophosphoesterase family protein [Ramlibacter sp.]|uniref:metallophosphoesterase family protein n=1 Tax=Ramlibacter sp. TaxID=1917967 RepID=UPI002D7E98B6|nr:metallophosphoesterase family protein [Ramlibacter sp.]HET8745155.1 metallophosphoesterase family protein [Ramlibacter sp.]
MRIGLVSDTHNLLRPEVLEYLRGSDHILHAGDICNEAVLQALAAIAPLTAVRGNNDRGAWAQRLREREVVQLGGATILVVHDIADLGRTPDTGGAGTVVSGHSHQPRVQEREGVLYVNPGSAGPRRFKLPISAGELRVAQGRVTAHLVQF